MAHRVVIEFRTEAGVHRIRNFGEALFRSLRAIDGRLSMAQADAAFHWLEVTHVHTRKLKRVKCHIEQLLAEHSIEAELRGDR